MQYPVQPYIQYLGVYDKDVKRGGLPGAPQHVDQVLHHTEITALFVTIRKRER